MESVDDLINSGKHPVIIAHRGASHYYHENTMAAFTAAVEMRAEMIELDVRRTADGALIVHHDPDIDKNNIGHMSLAQIRDMSSTSGFSVPTLADVLAFCKNRIPVDIELKEGGYEGLVLDEVLQVLDPGQFVITSVLDGAIRRVKERAADVRTGLIISSRPWRQLLSKLHPNARARRAGADVVVVSQKLLRLGFLTTAKKMELPVWVYTINDRKELWDLITDGRIGGIFTNRPDVALFLRDIHLVQSGRIPEKNWE